MRRKHIVLVTIEPPLPFGDAAARWYYVLLRGLVERGHRVTAFSSCSRQDDLEPARALFPAPDYDLRLFHFPEGGGIRGKLQSMISPFSYMFGPPMRANLKSVLAGGFDILHLEQLWSGWLGRKHVPRAVVSLHNLLSIDLSEARPSTLGEWRYRRLEALTEPKLIRSYSRFSVCTPRLVEPVRRINPKAVVDVIPFGIDFTLYPFIPDEARPSTLMVTLIGKMDWKPTGSAAERLLTRLWPEIRKRVPDARLSIVGRSARKVLADHLDRVGPEVAIVENVPEIRPYFEAASVLLYAPGRGSGLKIKVVEAMAYGTPVVTTTEGVEGLPAVDGVHAEICDEDAGLIDRAVLLLKDADRQHRMRRAARAMIEAACSPARALDSVEAMHESIVQGSAF